MNVYDFDKTIYNGDSTLDFYKFCLKTDLTILRFFPLQMLAFIKYVLGIWDKTSFKEGFYSFLKGVDNVDDTIVLFWKHKKEKIASWYLMQKNADDVIISASPYFLLKPICTSIGVTDLIASRVDKHTGKYLGENCYAEEKVRRYVDIFGNKAVDNFYSDSLHDAPFAEMAHQSFLVTKHKIIPWGEHKPSKK